MFQECDLFNSTTFICPTAHLNFTEPGNTRRKRQAGTSTYRSESNTKQTMETILVNGQSYSPSF